MGIEQGRKKAGFESDSVYGIVADGQYWMFLWLETGKVLEKSRKLDVLREGDEPLM